MTASRHPSSCACCGDLLRGAFSRRRFLQGAAAAGAAAAAAVAALGARGRGQLRGDGARLHRSAPAGADAPLHRRGADLTGKFSQFIIAGAAIGVVAEPFKDWHKAFWDNLATSIQLHHIKKRDRDRPPRLRRRQDRLWRRQGRQSRRSRPKRTSAALAEFRKQVAATPSRSSSVETGLMALNGKIEMFA